MSNASFATILAVCEGTVSEETEQDIAESVVAPETSGMKPNRKKKRKSAPPLTQEAAIAWVEEHGWSFSSLTSIWRRSRQDEEAIEIMADLTGLNRQGVRALLGLEDTVPEAQSQGIAAFWADY